MDLGLAGKVAVITGGSEGIGRATARRLAAEGATVVICARRREVLESAAGEIVRETGATVTAIPADVGEPAQIEALLDGAVAAHGRIDILVSNAGQGANRPFEELTDEAWQADLDVKLLASVRLARGVVPRMRAGGGGRIVIVTNVDGKAPGPGSLPASVSRAAGIALTKALSRDYARDDILVNTVCVGFIKSGQNDRRGLRQIEGDPGRTLDGWYAETGRLVPLGRAGESEEAADVIAFLVSGRAGYVTGAAVNIDGGLCAAV